MKALITASGQFGPFTSIAQGTDRWICDGAEFQFSVIGDATIGDYVAPPPPPPTVDQIVEAMTDLFDKTAQSRRYDNRITCALRAGYPGPFQAEGSAFATWMDACNAIGYTMLAQVQTGTMPMPATVEEALALLPEMVWP